MLSLVFPILFFSELGSYLWHRIGAHGEIVPKSLGVQESHEVHHTIEDDQATGDFLYILVFLVFYLYLLIYLVFLEKISLYLASILFLPVFLLSFWTWYIHSAYHIPDHWLNRYEWFRNDKRIHIQHHIDQTKNYGIATHFFDVIFESFDYGLSIN